MKLFGSPRHKVLWTVLAAALAGCPAVAAHAGSVPAPTESVRTTVLGVALPQNLVSAEWSVRRPGAAAELTVTGRGLTGTATAVMATWTSRLIAVPRTAVVVLFTLEDAQNTLAPSLDGPSTVRIQIRARIPQSSWTPWMTAGRSTGSASLLPQGGTLHVGIGGVSVTPDRGHHPVQIQVRYLATFTATETVQEQLQLDSTN